MGGERCERVSGWMERTKKEREEKKKATSERVTTNFDQRKKKAGPRGRGDMCMWDGQTIQTIHSIR
jgi:hypothetical protein